MADEPSQNSTGAPAPEELKPQSEDASPTSETPTTAAAPGAAKKLRRGSYRPSHRATFIGLTVVVIILAINAAVIAFVLKSQSKDKEQSAQGQVTINQDALSKLGVNRTAVGDSGVQLTVNPDAKFDGAVQVAGDVSVGGTLKLNSKFTASDASLTQLEAGNTSLSQLNVNGDGTLTNLNLRSGLTVAGVTRLQGTTTFTNLVTMNSGLNVSGNLSVGGALAIASFQTGNISISGHVVTSGSATTVSKGPALGAASTISISGNDAAGTVSAGTGVAGGGNGIIANITFHTRYTDIPNVVVTPSANLTTYVANLTTTGFSIGVGDSMPAGGYAFYYIVEQ